jgi:pimeloyl-ACP methyl ester carboxylesterase
MSNETSGTLDVSGDPQRIGRRTVLGTAAGAAGAALATHLSTSLAGAAQDATPDAAEGTKATFVLVPGQWTGAFVWHSVTPLLRNAGYDVYPVTCTGLGDRVHLANPAIDLDTHITDVVNAIEFADLHEVVLVGHSYAGMIITGVAELIPERLKAVVYLDADLPTDGQNSYEIVPPEQARDFLVEDISASVEMDTLGYRPVFPGIEEWLRGSINDPDEAEWFISRLVPHPELSNLQRVTLGNPAAAALPHVYVLCTADKDMEANPQTDPWVLMAERVRSEPNWTVIEMDDNHMVNLNNPQGTVDVLLSLI